MKTLLLTLAQYALRKFLSVSYVTWDTLKEFARNLDQRPHLTNSQRHVLLDDKAKAMLPSFIPASVRKRIVQAVVLSNRLDAILHDA